MFSWLGAINPWMLAGAAAIASPIIIHFLSKRRFRIVNWAAMDFLLAADRRNRRRIRLENFLLLLLRCLAIALIAFLIARPFFTAEVTGAVGKETARFERIIVLDDSPSMRALGPNKKPAFEAAKAGLIKFLGELSQNDTGDSVTLLVTSDPELPRMKGMFLEGASVQEAMRTVESLSPSDRSADLSRALLEVQEKHLETSPDGAINRTVYVITDMRTRDWRIESEDSDEPGPADILKDISEIAEGGAQIVDVGAEGADNLFIKEIKLVDDAGKPAWLIAGIDANFEVTVYNAGESGVSGFDVRLSVGDQPPHRQTMEANIAPGTEAKALFKQIPVPSDTDSSNTGIPIIAVIDRPDVLKQDNHWAMAGRLIPGQRALLVDGEPSSEGSRGETHWLERALQLSNNSTGILVDVKTDNEFEGVTDLSPYHLIFLCNVYQVSEYHQQKLDEWVRRGGGLVFALGGQIDKEHYNEKLFAGGKGLLPVEIVERREVPPGGASYTRIQSASTLHPMNKEFRDLGDGPAQRLGSVSISVWWHTVIPEALKKVTTVAFKYNDDDQAATIVDRAHGRGRVMVVTTPLDADWGNMPEILDIHWIICYEIAQYMARRPAERADQTVGESIVRRLETEKYRPEVTVVHWPLATEGESPRKREQPVMAVEDRPKDAAGDLETDEPVEHYRLDYEETDQVGFYLLRLSPYSSDDPASALFAMNLDPSEGELAPFDPAAITSRVDADRVGLVRLEPSLNSGVAGARTEFWIYLLAAVGVCLAAEQLLAWWFGRRRG